MPRKPKLPLAELHIEALSTGKLVGLVDEFTKQPIAQPNAKPRLTSTELRAIAQEQHRLEQLTVLVDAGLGLIVGYAREPMLRSPAKAGERAITLGTELVIIVPSKPWRRF